ncbi:MAG: protease complex subunit PrcB family protein, partial [Ruminococcus sp.]|nr:protease complex subunit PrcB family protein [Ruminococcus sp.]
MKRIISIVAVMAVLLAGCEQLAEESENTRHGAGVQTSDFSYKNISEITIYETGGEDGRKNNWSISQIDGRNIVVKTDRTRKKSTYNISDEDFQALTHINFSDYIGVKANTERIADAIYYNIEIIYDDGTKNIIEVYIPDLWHKLYEIIRIYEPEVEMPEPLDTDTEPPFPKTGTIGEYEYMIDNYKQGIKEKGYYFEKENLPDSPLYVYISGGEYGSGGYGLYITNIKVENGNFTITVNETSPEQDEEVTEAFTYPGSMIEISPKPENVEVKNQYGVKFNYIDMPLYYKEVSEEDILYDEEHNVKYAKNQLLISVFSETNEWLEIERIANEIDAEIVGYIEISGDYQIEFRNDKSLEELETIANNLNSYPFVINVTLNIISEATTADY